MSSTEQRVVASRRNAPRPPQPSGTAPTPVKPTTPEKPRKSRRPLIILAIIVALGAGAFGAQVLTADEGQAPEPTIEATPAPGQVQPVEAVSLNLAGGHYLRIGVSLQLAEESEGVEDARVLDALIVLFSGRSVAEVTSSEGREALRGKLVDQLGELYGDEVLDVYFTDYVTQ